MNELNIGPIDQRLTADVVVVGGGPAGMCAAIAAAREGVRVILIEQGGFCGGMAFHACSHVSFTHSSSSSVRRRIL